MIAISPTANFSGRDIWDKAQESLGHDDQNGFTGQEWKSRIDQGLVDIRGVVPDALVPASEESVSAAEELAEKAATVQGVTSLTHNEM